MAEQKTAEQAPAEQPQETPAKRAGSKRTPAKRTTTKSGGSKAKAAATTQAEQTFPVKMTRERDGAKRTAHDRRDLVRYGFDGFKPAS